MAWRSVRKQSLLPCFRVLCTSCHKSKLTHAESRSRARIHTSESSQCHCGPKSTESIGRRPSSLASASPRCSTACLAAPSLDTFPFACASLALDEHVAEAVLLQTYILHTWTVSTDCKADCKAMQSSWKFSKLNVGPASLAPINVCECLCSFWSFTLTSLLGRRLWRWSARLLKRR